MDRVNERTMVKTEVEGRDMDDIEVSDASMETFEESYEAEASDRCGRLLL